MGSSKQVIAPLSGAEAINLRFWFRVAELWVLRFSGSGLMV